MKDQMINNFFKYSDNLGFNNPYYFEKEGKFEIHAKLDEAISDYKLPKKIDSVAAVEVLNKNHPLGDRTVIQNIYKTPWLAKPNNDLNDWEFAAIPKHGHITDDPQKLAKKFFELLCEEILEYTRNKKTVGVLLSGGMDSRMVAGALDYLIKTKQVDVEVTALTWGNKNTRDVIYAERIAQLLGWKWRHFIVDGNALMENIKETGLRGCEYSPIHLHAIPQVKRSADLDVFLAGSYGDSIGRAEYGGIHVTQLKPLNQNISNVANLFREEVFQDSLPQIQKDIDQYHQLFPAEELYMQNEYDYQLHYMRRQLNPCMELLNEDSDFFQVFTSPKTFRFMWGVSASLRNDDLYKYMLTYFKTDLSQIPWARTGLLYGTADGIPDKHLKRHHTYVEIMNFEILDRMKELALSEEIKHAGIFNYSSIEELFRLTKKFPINSFYYTEKLAWIASLAVLMNEYKIGGENSIVDRGHAKEMLAITRKEYMPRYYRNKVGGYLRMLKLIK